MDLSTSRAHSRSRPSSRTGDRQVPPRQVDEASEREVSTVSVEDDVYVIVNGQRRLRTEVQDDVFQPGLPSTAQPQPPPKYAASDLESLGRTSHQSLSRQAAFASLRERALRIWDQLVYERRQYQIARDFVQESMEKAVAEFWKLPKPISTAQFLSNFKFHQREVEKDRKCLNDKSEKIDELQIALSDTEFWMQQEEEALALEAKATMRVLSDMGIRLSDEAKITAGVDHPRSALLDERDSVDDVPSLLRDYYGKVGDVKIIQERLVEFESDYQETRIRIVFDEEHDREPEMTLEELEQTSAQDRLQFQDALRHTVEIADTARKACIKAGLDPDEYKRNLPDQTDEIMAKAEEDGLSADFTTHISQRGLDFPGILRMAYPRAETLEQEPPAVTHIQPDNGSEAMSENNVGQSHEAVNIWIQDVPDYPDYGTDAPSWAEPEEFEKPRSDGRASMRNPVLEDNKTYINSNMIFVLNIWDVEDRPSLMRRRTSSDSDITQRLKNHPQVLKQLEAAIARRNGRLGSQQTPHGGPQNVSYIAVDVQIVRTMYQLQ